MLDFYQKRKIKKKVRSTKGTPKSNTAEINELHVELVLPSLPYLPPPSLLSFVAPLKSSL